jgi:hypothetical protein
VKDCALGVCEPEGCKGADVIIVLRVLQRKLWSAHASSRIGINQSSIKWRWAAEHNNTEVALTAGAVAANRARTQTLTSHTGQRTITEALVFGIPQQEEKCGCSCMLCSLMLAQVPERQG